MSLQAVPEISTDSLIANFTTADIDSILLNYAQNHGNESLSFHERYINLLAKKSLSENKPNWAAACYNLLGVQYRDEGRFEDAIKAFEQAREYAPENSPMMIEIVNNLGVVYRRQDKPRTAAKYHLQALKSIENYPGNYKDISFQHRVSLNSIGNIYLTLRQFNQARACFDESLALELKAENNLGIAINYANIGACFQYQHQLDSANHFYILSLEANKKIKSILGLALSYNNIGEVYLEQNEIRKAISSFDSAQVYSSKLNDNYHKSITHINLARAFIELPNPKLAWQNIQQLDSLSKLATCNTILQNLASVKSAYFEQTRQTDSALHFYKIAALYKDSVINETNSAYVNDILNLYESEKQQNKIALLSAQNGIIKQKQRLSIAIILLLLVSLSLVFIIARKRKKDAQQKLEVLHQQLLRSQMNPHFIFNALGSIQNYMYRNEPKKAAGYLGNFASLTRSILEHSMEDTILLDADIQTLRNYMELERMRMNGRFNFSIVVDEELDPELISIPPMMLQPFVENAIKHGMKEVKGDGQINISFSLINNLLTIRIEDNGIGINQAKSLKYSGHRSMSMQIFDERKKVFAKSFKKQILCEITDRSKLDVTLTGTLVNIQIPINQE